MNYNFVLKHKKNTKVVLLFHGLTGSPFELKKFGQFLYSNGYDVYAESLPGHGNDFINIKSVTYQDWLNFSYKKFEELSLQYNEIFVGGLCLGALLALAVAQKYPYCTDGVIALSTTLFLDGTRMPWYNFLSPVGYYTITRFYYNFPEGEPYGIKNLKNRNIIRKLLEKNDVGMDNYPMSCVYELTCLSKFVRKNLKHIFSPTLIIHSKEDDLTSIKSAYTIFSNISSIDKFLVVLKNSYHMILYDNEKDYVYKLCKDFLSIHSINKEGSIC